MKFKELYLTIINKGTEYHKNFYDQKRVRFINIISLVGLMVMFPVVLVFNFIRKDFIEVSVIIGIVICTIISLYLNMKGRNQKAAIILCLTCIIGSYVAVYFSEIYLAAPYVNLVIVLSAISLFKKRLIKNAIGVSAFFSFVFLNYYQLEYLRFETLEYLPIIVILLILYIAIKYSDQEYQDYQKQIEDNNAELESKNQTIQLQSERLLALEKEKHQYEIQMKEKDIESVLANNQMQLKIRQNIVDELEAIQKQEDSARRINSLKLDLKNQILSQKKIDITQENYAEVNAQFHHKLSSAHPNLSKKEKELCSYIRLGLSTKEMSALTNSSENTLYVTKTRLRKKLDLKDGIQINSYLTSL